MKVSNMAVTNVIIKQHSKVTLENISSQYMKVSNMAVTNVIIKQQRTVALEDISSQNMKVNIIDNTVVQKLSQLNKALK